MQPLKAIKELLKAKWIIFSFLLFMWLCGGLVFYSSTTSYKQDQLSQSLRLAYGLVQNQLQLLQLELGHNLSEELSLATASNEKLGTLQSGTKDFLAVGLVRNAGRGLTAERLFRSSATPGLSLEFVQSQLSSLNSVNEFKNEHAFLWTANGTDNLEYLFALLPYEIEGNKAWGLGVSRLPTSWLRFSGANSLFLLDKNTGRMISAYGGKNQGGGAELELAQGSSYQIASYDITSREAKAWQDIQGTNLILMLRENSSSPFLAVAGWGILSLGFLLGLLLMTKSPLERKRLYRKKEDKVETETEEKTEIETETAIKAPAVDELKPREQLVSSEPKKPVSKLQVPIESVVEDQLLENIFVKQESGHRVVEGISDVLTSLSHDIQAHGVRVNILVPEALRSDWPQTQLKTVLEEVVRNSLEAMEGADTKTLTFSAEERGFFIDLVVEDTGTGMTDEVLKRSLEAFFSTKPSLNKRRGLGLNVTKRLLEISGGKLQIESTPSVGTKVTLSFLKNSQTSLLSQASLSQEQA